MVLRMPGLATFLWLALLLAQPHPHPDPLESNCVVGDLGKQLDAQLARFAEYGFWGTVLVVRDGQVVLLKGYGFADANRHIANHATTRFEMNSMTKMFTGAAILQLDAAGRLHVGDSVDRYLGPFPAGKQGATVEQLANHTSGLVVAGTALAEESRDAFVHDVKRTPRESPPGERYRYTNAGFSLLAAIIEVVSSESFEDYLLRHLFAPAGMRSTTFRDRLPPEDSLFAHGYAGTAAALEPGPPNPYVWGTRGAGGVWATVGDIYRWLETLDDGTILPDAQRRVLFSPARPPALEAYGWHVESTPEGRRLVQKGGGSDDFASHFLYYPDDRLVIVWASNNLRQRWRKTLNRSIPDTIFGGTGISLPPVAAVPSPVLEPRAGRYVSERDTLELRAGPGYLYAEANRLEVPTDVIFFPQDASHFTGFDPPGGSQTRLWFDPVGDALTVELANGQRIVARRAAR
jgi:CubicO group peptidase (beta-lactamase class C family)